MSQWQDIKDFHEKFGLVYDGPPRSLPQDLASFRTNFLIEETDEYILASKRADELDALVDLVYVAMGTAYLHGFDFDEGLSATLTFFTEDTPDLLAGVRADITIELPYIADRCQVPSTYTFPA